MNLDVIYSRPAKTAAQLAEQALDRHRFLTKKVLLTGEREILRTGNKTQVRIPHRRNYLTVRNITPF